MGLGSMLDALGMAKESELVQNAKTIQGLRAIMMSEVLQRQLPQKGVQTEGDAKRIQQSVASISNTPEANQFMFRLARAYADRATESLDFHDEPTMGYRAQHKNLVGAQRAWSSYTRAVPLTGTVDGKLVFWNEFREGMKRKYPDATPQEIAGEWAKYAKRT
jgi:hypothetical protein